MLCISEKTLRKSPKTICSSRSSPRTLYTEAATYSHKAQDYATRDLFESLIKDEEHHIDFLETQLDLIGRLGVELYTQHHIGKPNKT